LALAALAALAGWLAAAPTPGASSGAEAEAPPPLELPDDVRPVKARVELEVDPSSAEGFRGEIALEVRLSRARKVIWLHGRGLAVEEASVEAGGARIPAVYTEVLAEGVASLSPAREVGPGPATLHLRWRAPWGVLRGLYLSKVGSESYASTQLEAVDARRVFPGFDEPSAKIPWDVTLVVPEGLVAVSNQPALSSTPAGKGNVRVRFAETRPLPSYLLFFGVGPFDLVTPPPLPANEVRDRPLAVRGLTSRGRGGEIAHALEAGAAIVAGEERAFGVPFPYEKLDHVAIPDFASSGMENAGAIAYRDSVLLFSEGGSPDPLKRRIAGLLAHEIGHQWFGDLVTLRWWTDVWLNEAFATWATPKGVAAWRPYWRPELTALRGAGEAMEKDGLASARKIRQPLARLSEVGLQFDAMSYQKGAAVIGMFERFAGPERFKAGVKAYLEAHRDGVASTPDFVAAVSKAVGRDLAPAFSTFLDQPGVPLVHARIDCQGGTARVRLAQERWQPRGATPGGPALWKVPVCVRAGRGARSIEACTLLESAEGALDLPGPCPEWIHPNAGGAGYYRFALDGPDLAMLLRRVPALTASEKIALGHSIWAVQGAGGLRYPELLGAVAILAHDPDIDVALSMRRVLEEARANAADPGDRAAVEGATVKLFRPAFDRLGWTPRSGEGDEAGRHRTELLEIVALTGRDRAVRAEAVRRGRAFLGLGGGQADPGALAPELVEPALQVAVQDDAESFETVLARAPGASSPLRQQLLGALHAVTDPSRFARVWAMKDEPRLNLRERIGMVQTWPVDARDLVADAFLADVDGVARIVPGEFTAALPRFAGTPCDQGRAARLRDVLAARLAAEPGMKRPLDQAVEAIAICAAGRETDAAAAGAAYRRLAGAR